MYQFSDREEEEKQEEVNQVEEKVLHVALDRDDGLYHLPSAEEQRGEEFGLTPPFPPERLDIMRARCASHGYELEVS